MRQAASCLNQLIPKNDGVEPVKRFGSVRGVKHRAMLQPKPAASSLNIGISESMFVCRRPKRRRAKYG
jgi:hypothetical protein